MRRIFFLLFLLMLPMSALAEDQLPPLPQGPLLLTSVRPEQLNPEYWINRLPTPDALIKTPQQIEELNRDIRAGLSNQVDIFALSAQRAGKPIADQIRLEYDTLKKRKLFDSGDKPVPDSIFESQIAPKLVLNKIPSQIKIKWGVAQAETPVRALPTMMKMIEGIGDYEFDQLQFTLIKVWTPIAIYHTSSDGQWYYIQAAYTRGWVRSRDIALFTSRDDMKKYVKDKPFLVVTGDYLFLRSQPQLRDGWIRVSMGTVLPIAGQTSNVYELFVPRRGENGQVIMKRAYAAKEMDVHVGFLPYTQRNIITQAFKLLGARYGWAGMYKGRDCSGFLQDVYLPFGIDMPRSSRSQGFAGTQLNVFKKFSQTEEKELTLDGAVPAVTILRMPSHMMIYLGKENGHYYVIHSTWAERYSMTSDAKNRINQVVVSDLELNGKSRIGSLFERIIQISAVD